MSHTDVTSSDALVPDVYDRLAGGFVEPFDWVQWGGVWTGRVTEVHEDSCFVELADWKQHAQMWCVTQSSVDLTVRFDSIDRIIRTGKLQFTLTDEEVQRGFPI